LNAFFIIFQILKISSSFVFIDKQEKPVKALKRSDKEHETIFKYPPFTLAHAFSNNNPHNTNEFVFVKNGVVVPLKQEQNHLYILFEILHL
jgi:hypothetical protein